MEPTNPVSSAMIEKIKSDSENGKNKYFSIILNKHGKYNDSIKASDYKKLKISRGSKYFLVFFFILNLSGS